MTVAELIEQLKRMPPEANAITWQWEDIETVEYKDEQNVVIVD